MITPSPRIIKDINQIKTDDKLGIVFTPDPNDFRHFYIQMPGPTGSCYEGGFFHVQFFLPENYPMVPPKALFRTKIYHPIIEDIDQCDEGRINIDILSKNWSPALGLRAVLLTLRSLLKVPYPQDGALNKQAFNHWKENKEEAEAKAAEWTKLYAGKK